MALAKTGKKKTELVLTSNYSTRVEPEQTRKRGKNLEGFLEDARRDMTKQTRLPDPTFTTWVLSTPHLVTISLDFDERMHSKLEIRPIILEDEIGVPIFFPSTVQVTVPKNYIRRLTRYDRYHSAELNVWKRCTILASWIYRHRIKFVI